ncbi:glycosyltransferase family 4 protein [Aeromonas veronii]|uniref:glycosyltransferase family 4 protein n=1 Tax=Aeromonas veronii TaxID=654 RepID=UPI003D230D2C
MKIFFDMAWHNMGGIGRFSSNVSLKLKWKTVYFKSHSRNPASPLVVLLLLKKLFLWRKNNVVMFPGYIPPLYSRARFIFTIHDLNHIDRPENNSLFKSVFYNTIILNGCKNASKILTVSEYSKEKIVEWARVPPSKVVNVGNGVDVLFSTDVAPYNPGYSYLICVSNRKLHKNECRLIEAFSKSNICHDIRLLFTGSANDYISMKIKELKLEDKIVFCGRVSDQELPSLYRGALGLVFPSLYEGFGLPVVEAMASGIPVLTSNTTSLPEVAGDAALLVNPESVDEIRVGIERLVHDETLRTELIAKGLERAKLFSWDAVAARVQAVLDEVTSQYGK